ncbi:hypothetical protein [Thermosphaera aggregans]|uniref:hypothetical protein n=1 Tax=Thermosphaera aggregans TaxID=54254 RepID=UPI001494955A|nr:hypothetical protein [Thermosphaera aggregans]
MCRMLKILDSPTMKPFTLRDCGDTMVVEIDNIVIVLDKRLEKTHTALRRLEIGLTLDTPLEAIEEFERLLRRRLKKLVVVSERYGEVGSSGGCLGSFLAGALDRLGDLKKLRQKLGGLLLAEVSITVTPSPPPGVGLAVSTVLSRLMWGGWITLVVAFIIGAINFARGGSEKGEEYVAGAIKGAVAMAFYTAVITGLIGWQREDRFGTSM